MRALHATCALASLILVGCGASEFDALRTRAAFEFDCPEREVRIRNLDEDGEAYGVSGCGERAVYLHVCDDFGDCKWVMNSARQ